MNSVDLYAYTHTMKIVFWRVYDEEAIAVLCATSDDEDAIPQVESQRPGAVPAVFVEMSEDTFKALDAGWVHMYASDARVISATT